MKWTLKCYYLIWNCTPILKQFWNNEKYTSNEHIVFSIQWSRTKVFGVWCLVYTFEVRIHSPLNDNWNKITNFRISVGFSFFIWNIELILSFYNNELTFKHCHSKNWVVWRCVNAALKPFLNFGSNTIHLLITAWITAWMITSVNNKICINDELHRPKHEYNLIRWTHAVVLILKLILYYVSVY